MHGPFTEFARLLLICALVEAGVARILNPFDVAADHAAARLARDILEQETPP